MGWNGLEFSPMTIKYVTAKYVGWLNDPEVTRYLETKGATIDSLMDYIGKVLSNPYLFMFALLVNKEHIGNIKLNLEAGDIGLMIGEKQYWGCGYGTQAIKEIKDFAFRLGSDKVWAGIHLDNIASQKAFTKAGFLETRKGIYEARK